MSHRLCCYKQQQHSILLTPFVFKVSEFSFNTRMKMRATDCHINNALIQFVPSCQDTHFRRRPLSPIYSDTTQLDVKLSCELSRFGHPLRRTTPIADGHWAARSQSVLSRSVCCLWHSFCCYSSISLSSSSSVQLSIISIRSYNHTNSRISWLFCIIHDVMTHKLLQLGHDVQNRRRAVAGSTTGSWVELSCVALYTSTTQLNSTRRRVELSCVAINGALATLHAALSHGNFLQQKTAKFCHLVQEGPVIMSHCVVNQKQKILAD